MSAKIASVEGDIITIEVAGKLTQPELAAVQKAAAAILQKQGRMRLLVVTQNFQGWERGGAWGDLSFQSANDSKIVKLALVGDKQWEDLALMFVAVGLRRFPIQFFQPVQLAEAKAWLAANP